MKTFQATPTKQRLGTSQGSKFLTSTPSFLSGSLPPSPPPPPPPLALGMIRLQNLQLFNSVTDFLTSILPKFSLPEWHSVRDVYRLYNLHLQRIWRWRKWTFCKTITCWSIHGRMSFQSNITMGNYLSFSDLVSVILVSSAAVIRVVTQESLRDDPHNGCEGY